MDLEEVLDTRTLSRILVEDCWRVNASTFTEDLNDLTEEVKGSVSPHKMKSLIAMGPFINGVDFTFLPGDEPKLRFEWVGADHKPYDQLVVLTPKQTPLGKRWYFECVCGNRAALLYVRFDTNRWACRKCQELRYELSTIHRGSLLGELKYTLNRWAKLQGIEKEMATLFYNGQPTKKFKKFLFHTRKWMGAEVQKKLEQTAREYHTKHPQSLKI